MCHSLQILGKKVVWAENASRFAKMCVVLRFVLLKVHMFTVTTGSKSNVAPTYNVHSHTVLQTYIGMTSKRAKYKWEKWEFIANIFDANRSRTSKNNNNNKKETSKSLQVEIDTYGTRIYAKHRRKHAHRTHIIDSIWLARVTVYTCICTHSFLFILHWFFRFTYR